MNLKRKKITSSSSSSCCSNEDKEVKEHSDSDAATAGPSSTVPTGCHEDDIGKFLGLASSMPVSQKKHLLQNGWTPSKNYDFAADAKHLKLKRKFNHQWLDTYSPWLSYSSRFKGAFCKYCVLFPPSAHTMKGGWGSFIIRPFTKYKDVHDYCKAHVKTQGHQAAMASAKSFLEAVPVDIQLDQSSQKLIEKNKKVLSSIVSCIIFSGAHDLPLRGKNLDEGVLVDLCRLRIEAGDSQLKEHFEHAPKNASYRSPTIQNEIIDLCGTVIREQIVTMIKGACAYSILADETADISGKEQLSIGLRFFDEKANEIKEDFLGFVELEGLDAKSIAKAIENFVTKLNLDPDNCVGLGFDGCSTMSGQEGGVQAILRHKYKKSFVLSLLLA